MNIRTKTTETESLHLEKLIDEIIPYATTNTAIIQSSPVGQRLPPIDFGTYE